MLNLLPEHDINITLIDSDTREAFPFSLKAEDVSQFNTILNRWKFVTETEAWKSRTLFNWTLRLGAGRSPQVDNGASNSQCAEFFLFARAIFAPANSDTCSIRKFVGRIRTRNTTVATQQLLSQHFDQLLNCMALMKRFNLIFGKTDGELNLTVFMKAFIDGKLGDLSLVYDKDNENITERISRHISKSGAYNKIDTATQFSAFNDESFGNFLNGFLFHLDDDDVQRFAVLIENGILHHDIRLLYHLYIMRTLENVNALITMYDLLLAAGHCHKEGFLTRSPRQLEILRIPESRFLSIPARQLSGQNCFDFNTTLERGVLEISPRMLPCGAPRDLPIPKLRPINSSGTSA